MMCLPTSLCLQSFSNTTLRSLPPLPPLPLQVIGQTSSIISMKVKVKASGGSDTTQVDYNSMASSVFPAEACETVGGVACDVEMFPETKLKQQPKEATKQAEAQAVVVDREYLEYNSPKTVFIAEACDDLGGEFCDADST